MNLRRRDRDGINILCVQISREGYSIGFRELNWHLSSHYYKLITRGKFDQEWRGVLIIVQTLRCVTLSVDILWSISLAELSISVEVKREFLQNLEHFLSIDVFFVSNSCTEFGNFSELFGVAPLPSSVMYGYPPFPVSETFARFMQHLLHHLAITWCSCVCVCVCACVRVCVCVCVCGCVGGWVHYSWCACCVLDYIEHCKTGNFW